MSNNPNAGTVANRYPDPEIVELDYVPPANLVDTSGQPVQKHQSRLHTFFHRKKTTEFIMPEKDAETLRKVKRRAYLLDRGFRICCCNIGIDPIIGLIPVFGDGVATILSMTTINLALKAGLPKDIITRMYINVAIDFMLGFIPILGDIADYFYKCNTRNAVLLEEYLVRRGKDYTLLYHGKLPFSEFNARYPEFAASHPEEMKQGTRRSVVLDSQAKHFGLDYGEVPRNQKYIKSGVAAGSGADRV